MGNTDFTSKKDFESSISRGITLVDFNASWCGPCKAQEPIINELGKTYDGEVTVSKIDIDAHRDIALWLGIQSIPTIIVFNAGKEVHRFIGVQTSATLEKAVNALLQNDESFASPLR